MKLKKFFAAAAACMAAAVSAVLPVNAVFTEAGGNATTTLPQLQAPAPTADGSVPAVTFNVQTATSASGGAVLGNSTPADSASTGDKGVLFAVAGLFVTAGVGAAAVALKNRKKD